MTVNNKISWKKETFICPDRWRKKESFQIIYPWREEKLKEFKIKKEKIKSDELLTIKIDFWLPESGWEIKVNSWRRKFIEISPQPDFTDERTAIYKNTPQQFNIILKYSLSEITDYIPEIEIKKEWKAKEENEIPEELQIKFENFNSKKKKFIYVKEKIYNFGEKVVW